MDSLNLRISRGSPAHNLVPGVLAISYSSVLFSVEGAAEKVAAKLACLLREGRFRPPLCAVCIGTDRSTGDALGPLVGSYLQNMGFRGRILGTLDQPVHAENLSDALAEVEEGRETTVLGVDACLGTRSEIGSILVRRGPLIPGLGVKKRLPPVGDLHVAGVVNLGGFMEYVVLQNTRLSLVMRMAQVISKGIVKAENLFTGSSAVASGEMTEPKSRVTPWGQGISGLLLPPLGG